jgi:hypothetical protein|tara:strand:+ start:85 stop:501 length:417 start_codon:yes stop_codon:yes gene_type:complete
MAHFAKISEENEVLQVVVVDNNKILDENGVEQESIGQTFLETNNNWPANLWVQTSYNSTFRKNYAGMGCSWYPDHNFFIGPKPFLSWTLNTTEAIWDPPIAKPDLTAEQISQNNAGTHYWYYNWDEPNQVWNLTDINA